jgi:Trypsin-co-occurring domain 1
MAQRKEIAQFLLDDGTPFLIEIEEAKSTSLERVSRAGLDEQIVQAKQSFEQALDQVTPVASAALNRLRQGLTTPADEVELKFGVKLTAPPRHRPVFLYGQISYHPEPMVRRGRLSPSESRA